jgi:cell fate regulator YaaT (PSP1 superfamily)
MKYTLNTGESNPGMPGFAGNTNQKLPVVNWLADLPETQLESDLVEVQFKNTRKSYFLNCNKLMLNKGEKVVVEAAHGQDLGEVTLTGRLVLLQIKKNNVNMEKYIVRRLYRKARQMDIEKYEEAKKREHSTMIQARKIAEDLKLDMKIGDVEYQGDGSKAIFYYIADGRVDFRELRKVLAEFFHVRIEMKQIGARQEAGRIGGIGPCGRELCCATWVNNFVSVSTNAARIQDISTNPLKLAGQCAKIKCCINYEVPVYADATADFPSKDFVLQTLDSDFYHIKTDVFKQTMTYSTSPNSNANLTTVPVERVKDIIALNKQGKKVDSLLENEPKAKKEHGFYNVVGQDNLERYDNVRRDNRQQRKQHYRR